eukprot:jgi/Botrbrau1/5129/Bobra.0172s0001.1
MITPWLRHQDTRTKQISGCGSERRLAAGKKQIDGSETGQRQASVPESGQTDFTAPFTFACPQLEAAFQAYTAEGLNVWTWVCHLIILTGWLKIFYKLLMGTGGDVSTWRIPLLVGAVCQLLPTLLGIVLHLFWPTQLSKHHRAVNTLSLLGGVLAAPALRELLMWISRSGTVPTHAMLRDFADENLFLIVMWLRAAGFPVGTRRHVAILLGGLLLSLASNGAFCDSLMSRTTPATLSARPLAAAQLISDALLELGAPFYAPRANPARIISCPAAMAVWQVVGSLVAGVTVYLAEVSRRRAFLRTNAALTRLGPDSTAAALEWPFGRASMVLNCVFLMLLLSIVHAIIWAMALDIFV